jgi:hypothetical protein
MLKSYLFQVAQKWPDASLSLARSRLWWLSKPFVGNGFKPFPTGTLQQACHVLDTGKDKGWCRDE